MKLEKAKEMFNKGGLKTENMLVQALAGTRWEVRCGFYWVQVQLLLTKNEKLNTTFVIFTYRFDFRSQKDTKDFYVHCSDIVYNRK